MEATPTKIIDYFSGFKQNLIPLIQRPYTWGERQWHTLPTWSETNLRGDALAVSIWVKTLSDMPNGSFAFSIYHCPELRTVHPEL